MRKKATIAVALLAACTLSSCSIGDVETQLRAPRPTGEQQQIQQALDAYITRAGAAREYVLKFPQDGEYLSAFAMEDVDGDGKVEVLIENLALGIAYSNQKIANDNTFMAHLASGDVLLFAAEPAYYDKKIASLSEDGSSFFAPLSNGDTYVRWHPGRQDVSEELYIGVRPATGTAKQNQSYEQCRRLLEQLMAQN